jgi:hypothetical protein
MFAARYRHGRPDGEGQRPDPERAANLSEPGRRLRAQNGSVNKRNVELTWDMRTAIAHIDGRVLVVSGENFGDVPDIVYVIYARYITAWDDGTPLSDEEQAELLDEVVDEAARRGWKFEIDWS